MSVADFHGATKGSMTPVFITGWIDRHGFAAAMVFCLIAWAGVSALALAAIDFLF